MRPLFESVATPSDVVVRQEGWTRLVQELVGTPTDSITRFDQCYRVIGESIETPSDAVAIRYGKIIIGAVAIAVMIPVPSGTSIATPVPAGWSNLAKLQIACVRTLPTGVGTTTLPR
jgi:hypothetical protein